MQTWFLLDEDCPSCGYWMASNGYFDWCMNDDVCGYCRKPTRAPLDSQNDDPDELPAFNGEGLA